jgi:hypothetical protein
MRCLALASALALSLLVSLGCAKTYLIADLTLIASESPAVTGGGGGRVIGKDCIARFGNSTLPSLDQAIDVAQGKYPTTDAIIDARITAWVESYPYVSRLCVEVQGSAGSLTEGD